jgi:putative endonuclease
VLVFVEVRSRCGAGFGTPLESVDGRKQRAWRASRGSSSPSAGWHDRDARFDVIGIRFDEEPPRVEHVQRRVRAGA